MSEWHEWYRPTPLERWRESENYGPTVSALKAALIPNPIRKALSTFQSCKVRAVLMGGQACVFYVAAEFSRGTELALLAETEDLALSWLLKL